MLCAFELVAEFWLWDASKQGFAFCEHAQALVPQNFKVVTTVMLRAPFASL